MPRPASRRSPFAGNKGQGSNWIWRPTRLRIYARDGWKCIWCQCDVSGKGEACLDHVVPRTAGGSHAPGNLLTSCFECNEARGTLSALAFAYTLPLFADQRGALLERVLHAMGAELPALPKAEAAAA